MPTPKSATALLVAMAALLVLLSASVASATSLSTPVTGCSFFWFTATGTSATAKDAIKATFQDDMQAAAGAGKVVAVTDLMVNATAMFVEYTITPDADANAAQAAIMASTLPKVNRLVADSANTLQDIADLFPTEVLFTTDVLYPAPPGAPEPELEIVGTTTSKHIVFISGAYDTWKKVVESPADKATLTAALAAAADEAIFRPLVITDVSITSLEPQKSDRAEEQPEDTVVGLVADMTVKQELQRGGHRVFTVDEVNSIMLMMDLETNVDPIYRAHGGTGETVRVITAGWADASGKMVCTGLCKGMIAMGAVAGALMIALIVLMIIYCCCFGEKREEKDSAVCEEEEEEEDGQRHTPYGDADEGKKERNPDQDETQEEVVCRSDTTERDDGAAAPREENGLAEAAVMPAVVMQYYTNEAFIDEVEPVTEDHLEGKVAYMTEASAAAEAPVVVEVLPVELHHSGSMVALPDAGPDVSVEVCALQSASESDDAASMQ